MTATVEFLVCDIFRLIEAKSDDKFCDICNRHLKITAFHRHMKSNRHLGTLYQRTFSIQIHPNKGTSRHQPQK